MDWELLSHKTKTVKKTAQHQETEAEESKKIPPPFMFTTHSHWTLARCIWYLLMSIPAAFFPDNGFRGWFNRCSRRLQIRLDYMRPWLKLYQQTDWTNGSPLFVELPTVATKLTEAWQSHSGYGHNDKNHRCGFIREGFKVNISIYLWVVYLKKYFQIFVALCILSHHTYCTYCRCIFTAHRSLPLEGNIAQPYTVDSSSLLKQYNNKLKSC